MSEPINHDKKSMKEDLKHQYKPRSIGNSTKNFCKMITSSLEMKTSNTNNHCEMQK